MIKGADTLYACAPLRYPEHMFDWRSFAPLLADDGNGGRVIILGIDPGLANTGWGVVEQAASKFRCIAYGCITTPAHENTAERLATIHAEIVSVIARYAPSQCAIENVYFANNAKSAFATGQARGVALLATAGAALELGEYSPVQIKSTVTGSGTADKKQIQYMVRTILGLPHEPKPDHAADALAAAICHANMRGGVAAAAARAETAS
jgi:crossover junction endodeoxyribonuclease RuvC